MRKGILLAMGGLAFLAGCGDQGNKASTAPAAPQWKAPYVIAFDTKPAKPNPAGVTLPAIKYTPNTQSPERRAALVVRFDPSGAKNDQSVRDQMIMGPVDLSDTGGALPADYMNLADKGLATLLGDACMKGSAKVKVVLVRSSIKPDADDAEIDEKRLSDWLPIDVVFKNPHPKCPVAAP
jgi:hypothetical protein